jgi:hypothetical protein
MPQAKRLKIRMLILFTAPIVAISLVVGYTKAKANSKQSVPLRATALNECATAVQSGATPADQIGLNEVCTCLGDKLPQGSVIKEFLNTKAGSRALGRCIFLAKDGL